MVALGEYRRLLCPCGCGYLAEVSQAKENDGRFEGHEVRCHARTAILIKASRKQDHSEAVIHWAELRQDET